ncbi:MAG: hypothetical protein AseanaTS_19240 [Candidatus Pelagadaptatus aseana]|uniref:hypothetical protein n=1 Tax=Candidatus Pelagadaptatus aseana TaxID=3120508 RepID=UPI0039B1D88F
MKLRYLSRALLPFMLAATLPVSALAAEPLKTQTIKPTAGHQGISGVKVVSVTPENDQWVKVELSLPEDSENEAVIEEIIVVGHPDSAEVKQVKPYEVINDPESGRSGIVIYMDKMQDFALTINYSEPQPDVVPDRNTER